MDFRGVKNLCGVGIVDVALWVILRLCYQCVMLVFAVYNGEAVVHFSMPALCQGWCLLLSL